MGVNVVGLRETTRALERAGVDVNELKDVMARVSNEAAEVMAGFTPVGRTGRLRASVRGNRAKGKAVVAVGGARVPYAGAINYGWRRRNIRPADFIARTDAVMETRAPEILAEGWNEIAERHGLV
jgi:hypothetical protein